MTFVRSGQREHGESIVFSTVVQCADRFISTQRKEEVAHADVLRTVLRGVDEAIALEERVHVLVECPERRSPTVDGQLSVSSRFHRVVFWPTFCI